jgi:uncharacterized Zn-finger protein
LVVPKAASDGKRSCSTSPTSATSTADCVPSAARHWKKFLKDQAADAQDEAENLSCPDKRTELSSRVVAQALLSLSQDRPLSSSHCLPSVVSVPPLRPIATFAARPLQPSHVLNRQSLPNAQLPWSHRLAEQSEPENLSTSQRVKAMSLAFNAVHSSQHLLQSPTVASSTCNLVMPLRELQSNCQLAPVQLPTVPLPLGSSGLPHSTSPFEHPAFSSENLASVRKKSRGESRRSSLASPSAGAKPFHCAECRKSFSTQSGHAKHLQLHCNNQIAKSFSCKYCSKGYTSLSALKMHIRTHTLPCKCDVCGKSFSRPWLLQGHVRTHTGDKPFACNFCTRSFADKSNLRAHLQTHLQTKKYSCPGCQKTFSRMSLLNKHTDGGCAGLQSRNEECVQTLIGLSSGGLLRA